MTSQIRRAAVSILSNIAEGAGRQTVREFRHFLSIARGSNQELKTQLVIAAELSFGTAIEFADANSLSTEVGRMLSAMIRQVTTSQ